MIDIMKKIFKPRNFKLPLITYLSDVFFKYAFGRDNDPRCKKLRDFLIENIIGFVIEDLKVVNPELIPEHALQKKNILDVLLENEDFVIDLEMENHSLDLYTCNRVEIYGAKTTAYAQIKGDDYDNARVVITIFIINDCFEESNQLIERMSTGTDSSDHHFTSGQQCHYKFFVQLPMIDRIAKEKEELDEFEALMYLIRHQTLEGIRYKEEEGMVESMKELKTEFIREAPALYDAAVERQYQQTIDYDAFMRSQVRECIRREEKAKANAKAEEKIKRLKEEILFQAKEASKLDAQKNIDIGERKALIKTCDLLIRLKYKEKNNSWLKRCTIDELNQIILYTQEDESHDYDKLMDLVFSPSSTRMPSR